MISTACEVHAHFLHCLLYTTRTLEDCRKTVNLYGKWGLLSPERYPWYFIAFAMSASPKPRKGDRVLGAAGEPLPRRVDAETKKRKSDDANVKKTNDNEANKKTKASGRERIVSLCSANAHAQTATHMSDT